MRIRLTLDANLDANLIARIQEKANGGSINEATRFLLRFWYEQEMGQNRAYSGQNMPIEGQSMPTESKANDVNLSGLDAINLDF